MAFIEDSITSSINASSECGVCAFVSKAGTIAIQVASLAEGPASLIPALSLAIAPFSLFKSVKEARGHCATAHASTKVTDKMFYGFRATSALGSVLSNISSPASAILALQQVTLNSAASTLMSQTIPFLSLVTGSIGLGASLWELQRTWKDYQTLKKEGKAELANKADAAAQARFRSSFSPNIFPVNEEKNTYTQCRKGALLSMGDTTTGIVSSSLALTAGLVALFAHAYISSAGLTIASASLSLVPILVKYHFRKKSGQMVLCLTCQEPRLPHSKSSTSLGSLTMQA